MLQDIANQVDNGLNGKVLKFVDEHGLEIGSHKAVFWLGGDLKFLRLMLGQKVLCLQD